MLVKVFGEVQVFQAYDESLAYYCFHKSSFVHQKYFHFLHFDSVFAMWHCAESPNEDTCLLQLNSLTQPLRIVEQSFFPENHNIESK